MQVISGLLPIDLLSNSFFLRNSQLTSAQCSPGLMIWTWVLKIKEVSCPEQFNPGTISSKDFRANRCNKIETVGILALSDAGIDVQNEYNQIIWFFKRSRDSRFLCAISQLINLVNWCCCSVAKLCQTLCDPVDCSLPGFPVLYYLSKFAQTHVHWIDDAIGRTWIKFYKKQHKTKHCGNQVKHVCRLHPPVLPVSHHWISLKAVGEGGGLGWLWRMLLGAARVIPWPILWRALSKASVFHVIDYFLPWAELSGSLCSFYKESIPRLSSVESFWMKIRMIRIYLQPCSVTPGKFQTPTHLQYRQCSSFL